MLLPIQFLHLLVNQANHHQKVVGDPIFHHFQQNFPYQKHYHYLVNLYFQQHFLYLVNLYLQQEHLQWLSLQQHLQQISLHQQLFMLLELGNLSELEQHL
jgi:hypothetical protein